jgi:signal transduction histidine kinase
MFSTAVAIAAAIPVALGVLVARRGRRLIGWLLVAHGLSVGVLLGGSQVPGSGRSSLVADQLLAGSWIFLFLWLVLVAYLVPDGRPPSVGWRRWMLCGLLGAVSFLVGSAGDREGFRAEHQGAEPPLTWLAPLPSGVLGVTGLLLVVLLFFGSALAIRSRLRSSTGEARMQLMWLVWGATAVPVGLLVVWANHFLLGNHAWLTDLTLTAVSVTLPTAIATAILRHRLFDIQVVLSRTLVYGALVVGVFALYALLLLGAESLGGSGAAGGLVAVAVVAVVVNPSYSRLRRGVERWVYGYRSEPHRALRLLADRAESVGPGAWGATVTEAVTEAVAEALRVDRVRFDTSDDRQDELDDAEQDGGGAPHVRTPLLYRGERVGDLVVEIPDGRRLSGADRSLLHDLARYAAVLVHSERQGQQLRESRRRIVAGREEERRRLRQDLHDGVGPSLAAVVLKLNAAQSRPDGAERLALLGEAREEVREAISEVRRVVDDLRPPAIDEVGLLGAIGQRAATLSVDLVIEVIGPDPLPPLPAAVEVAAYRIASEAMANVVRHAHASRCRIEVHVDGCLELSIADNGHGDAAPSRSGMGWLSMHERAAELGGTCTISSHADGGLLVRAVLPIDRARAPVPPVGVHA